MITDSWTQQTEAFEDHTPKFWKKKCFDFDFDFDLISERKERENNWRMETNPRLWVPRFGIGPSISFGRLQKKKNLFIYRWEKIEITCRRGKYNEGGKELGEIKKTKHCGY